MSCYEFRPLQAICKEFNTFKNTLRRKEQKLTDLYPQLAENDERRNLSKRHILEKMCKYGDFLFYQKWRRMSKCKYKDAFSLRDEIGTHPNIEVEMDMMGKSPFFIRPYHWKEENKQILDREMKMLFHLGILKEGIS